MIKIDEEIGSLRQKISELPTINTEGAKDKVLPGCIGDSIADDTIAFNELFKQSNTVIDGTGLDVESLKLEYC